MTTFREFLLNRDVINESLNKEWKKINKTPRIIALKELEKQQGSSPIGFSKKDQKEKVIEMLNELIPNDEDKFNDWKEVVETWNEYEGKKRAHDVDNGDISDVPDEDKPRFIIDALKNRMDDAIGVNESTAKEIADILRKADEDRNGKIVKNELVSAIKDIKKKITNGKNAIGNKTNYIASLLYFVYLAKSVKDTSMITNEGGISAKNAPQKGIDKDNLGELNKRLAYFKNLNFGIDVLSIFKTPAATIRLMNSVEKGDETQLEKFNDKFVDKKVESEKGETEKKGKKSKEETEEQKQARKEVEEAKAAKDETDKNIQELKQQREELTKERKTGREEATSKKKFYIFDIDTPEPSDELDDWFDKKMGNSNYDGGVMGMLKKIETELAGYEPKSKDNDLNETVAKVFKKNGIIFEDYQKTSGKIKKLIEKSRKKIEDYLAGAKHKAKTLQANIGSSHDYKETIELRRQFKQLFIDLGYVLSQEIRSLVRATDLKMDSLKNAKKREEFNNYKTTDQLGQEKMDSGRIVSIIDGNGIDKDEGHIARFMLINLLNNNKSSDSVLEFLKAKSFEANKNSGGNRAYVYSSDDGNKVYALSKKDVKPDTKGNITSYKFDKAKARVYRNPAALLKEAVGIDVEKLTPDVLKAVKKEIDNSNIKDAEVYLNFANELSSKIRQTKENASMVAEESVVDYAASIEKHSHKMELNGFDLSKIDPTGSSPENVALRQMLGGGYLVKRGNECFITMEDPFATAEKETAPQQQPAQQQQNTSQQPNNQPSGSMPIDWNNWDYSVVTSTNADSTYGDGYGYNKKTDAIKKKLNSTTYTYMPNSKMRIVRRTFD